MRWAPHDYQKAIMRFMVGNAVAGVFADPGLGKTISALGAFDILRRKGAAQSMLVIAPLRPCYSVWPAEAAKWDEVSHLRVQVLHGPKKDEALKKPADVYVINPAGLGWYSRNVKKLPDVLCVDESTRFKHTNTQQFKELKPLLPKFRRRYILTGSPAPNGLLDLFGQIYILDLGTTLGRYITYYKTAYFNNPDGKGWTWVPREGAAEQIHKKLKPLVMRLEAKDFLDLPPLIENIVEVELPSAAMKAYKQMEGALIASLEEWEKTPTVAVAANASVAWGKCRQIANGGIFHDDGEGWTHIHKAKVEAVADLVDELSGKPALVAYEYRHDLDRLRKALGAGTPYIGGGVPARRFREIEVAWNRGDLPVLLAQPQSVAHGLNLQGTGAAVIDAGLTPDLEIDEQFVRRVWRQGQKERVVRHRIVAKGTVDEALIKMLQRKDRTQKALLAALKTHLRARR